MPIARPLLSLDNLIERETILPALAGSVLRHLRAHGKGLITGRAGAGKTTLLDALIPHLPVHTDFLVMRHDPELQTLPADAARVANIDPADLRSRCLVLDEIDDASTFCDIVALLWAARGFLGTKQTDSAEDSLAYVSQFSGLFDFVLHCGWNVTGHRHVCDVLTLAKPLTSTATRNNSCSINQSR